MNTIIYIIAAVFVLLLGFVWDLCIYAWVPILIAVLIDVLMRKNDQSNRQ